MCKKYTLGGYLVTCPKVEENKFITFLFNYYRDFMAVNCVMGKFILVKYDFTIYLLLYNFHARQILINNFLADYSRGWHSTVTLRAPLIENI